MADGAWAAGLVLAAGGSRRLGRPKQLLPYSDATLLDHTLGVARASGLDQVVRALGGASAEVRAAVDLRGVDAVENRDYDGRGHPFAFGRGPAAASMSRRVSSARPSGSTRSMASAPASSHARTADGASS